MASTEPAFSSKQRVMRRRAPKFATFRNILALMLREMSTRYGRTPGGYIWSVLEPFAAIMFLSIGFSLLLRSPSLGTSVLLFYATGYLPLNLYNSLAQPIARSISFSRPLLRFPAVNWMDALLARFILNSLTNVLICVLLFTVILSIVESRTVLDLPPIIEAFSLAMMLGLGVGAVNCVMFGLFPVWEVIWGIVTRPLFLASGVIFIYEDLPALAQNILWYNPLIHITRLMRTGFYPTYSPTYINIIYVMLFSMIALTLGLLFTRRYNRVILHR